MLDTPKGAMVPQTVENLQEIMRWELKMHRAITPKAIGLERELPIAC